MSFSIERFVSLSKAVDTNDIDWDYVARVGITDDEARVLRYMADTESHTIIYLRDLLAGHTARDPEIAAFMSCWVYEEFNHGRAIDRFLSACGRPPANGQYTKVAESASWVEGLEAFFTLSLPHLTPHFAAVHMAWGAIDEMMAAMAYVQLSQYTRNRELSKLLLRMAKDERRHQSFYFHQAERRMQHPLGQRIARFGLEWLWSPVGIGVGGSEDDLAFIAWMLLDSPRGREELRHNDRIMGRLPGMSGCSLSFRRVGALMKSFHQRFPEEVERLRVQRRELGVDVVSSGSEMAGAEALSSAL
ncbi:MAG: hypothetical protein JNJ46_18680 [Myxococcales bacterium]|nr:hypothetical protein [Myxococcales bacterium]